ncbi:MAG: CDP-alcohol phosphatidyltransferase family protein [Holosporales bacterium]|nr:CDP-alcohol phosphatidyltransferase family protein [Holosporales bacterium]
MQRNNLNLRVTSFLTLPNFLSFGRLAGAGILPLFMQAPLIAFILFSLASISDFFDGWVARKHKSTSTVGRLLDPLADKFLVGSAYFLLFRMEVVPAWLMGIIMARDIAIILGVIYLWYEGDRVHFTAGPILLSKINTFVQLSYAGFMFGNSAGIWHVTWSHATWVLATLTIASGISYLEFFLERRL